MMDWVKKLGVFFVSLAAMGSAPVAPSFGQGAPAGFMNTYFEEHDYSGQHCPGLTWHIDRVVQPDKIVKFSGPIWYADGSGVSFAKGTGESDGKFTLTVSTMSGDGPAGTITGQRHPDGSVEATAVGPPCFAGKLRFSADATTAAPGPLLILPSRAFAGPTQYPPTQFAAYGIVAFTSMAMSDDISRYRMICNAYIASLPSYERVPALTKDQMVTVWPIETNKAADQLNAMTRDDGLCKEAVSSYGLVTAQSAISDAKRSNAELDGLGPFLLAWSPSAQKGRADALVLILNLSDVTTYEQAKQIFLLWSQKIASDPKLWRKGWNLEELRINVRLWADKWGPKILKIFNSGSN